jgi:hypothetical protein
MTLLAGAVASAVLIARGQSVNIQSKPTPTMWVGGTNSDNRNFLTDEHTNVLTDENGRWILAQ